MFRKSPESVYDIPVKYTCLFVDHLGNFGKRIETVYLSGKYEMKKLREEIERWNTQPKVNYPKYQYKIGE